jgi:putative acetyltransferase
VHIRDEEPGDAPAVRRVNETAFAGPAEADLVEALHAAAAVTLSLVAVDRGAIVGHILFSPVDLDGVVGLAPMAVAPARQGAGIGSALVRAGLERLAAAGVAAVVVVGHPSYYPRFGFQPAARFGLRWEHGHDDAFFALELVPGALAGGGVVRYRPEVG